MNKVCPKCNAVNDDNANFCRYCGSALPKVENTQPNNEGTYANYSSANSNQYQNAQTYTDATQNYQGDIFGVPANEISACVGKHANQKYMNDFFKKARTGKKAGFNVVVFLFGLLFGSFVMSFWFFHRRLNKIGAIIALVGILTTGVSFAMTVPVMRAAAQIGYEATQAEVNSFSNKYKNNSSPFNFDEFSNFDEFDEYNFYFNNDKFKDKFKNDTPISSDRVLKIFEENGVNATYGIVLAVVALLVAAIRITLCIVCGIFANAWYLKDIIARINKLKATNPQATTADIERVGGTRCAIWVTLLVLGIVLAIVLPIGVFAYLFSSMGIL